MKLPFDQSTKKPSDDELQGVILSCKAANYALVEKLAKDLIEKYPQHTFGWKALGIALQKMGMVEKSLGPKQRAVFLDPQDAEAHSNLGNTLRDLHCFSEAEMSYRQAILIKPSAVEAHCNLGNMLRTLGRLPEAEMSYRQAIRIKPDLAEAHTNLGNALRDLGRLVESEACHREAIRIQPDFSEAYINLGNALQDLGRLPEAEMSYRQAIRIKPDLAEAHSNLAISLLLKSNFEEGLKRYEWRWNGMRELQGRQRNFTQPLWLGKVSLKDKTILIHSEQGLGDTIQFCRYICMVKNQGAKVILELEERLIPLLINLEGVDEIVPKGEKLPSFDFHCPMLSLPLAFNTKLNSIPAPIPYLSCAHERIEQWSKKIASDHFKIGLCWKGSKKDRSIPVEYFYTLSQLPQTRILSLHKGEGEKELECLPAGIVIESLGKKFDQNAAFLDTAAVMKCCDLVITSDTSVAHLAGALGVPTWVALPFIPDWRWMLERNDSPWYPTLRLFRQKSIGDWRGVIDQMVSTLKFERGLIK